MWWDSVDHIQKDCVDFTKALWDNVVYLFNGRVHASKTGRALAMNTVQGSMKRIMEEAVARHVKAVYY